MRTIIQRKKIKRHIAVILNAKTNRFIRNGLQFKRTSNRFAKLFDGMILEKTKHFDVLPDAEFLPHRSDEPATQDIEFLRQIPVLERLAELKTVGTAFGNRKIMNGIVMRVVLAPITPMNRNNLVADETANVIHVADHRDGLVSVFRRYGVIVAMKSHRRKRVRVAKLDATAFEFLLW